MSPVKELFDLNCKLLVETDKAIRVDDGKTQAWLPKSQIELEHERDGTVTITLPMWLAKEKDFL